MTVEKSKFAQYGYWLLVLAVSVWAIWARFGDLEADPAFHLSKSAGVLFDPFSHSGNARSYILFGDLHPDQWNTYVYSPLYVLLQVVWFSIWGISVKTMHAYGATWSLLAVALSWFCFRQFGKLAGILGLTFFSAHYIFAQFGRLALLENCAALFSVLTFLCLASELTRWRAFLCGAFAFLVFVTKGTIFYVVPAAGAAVVISLVHQYLDRRSLKESLIIFAWYLLGTLVVFVPWLVFFRIPNQAEISRLGGVWWTSAKPESLAASLDYLINDQLFQKIDRHDLLSIVFLVMAGITVYRLLTDWRKVHPLVGMFLFYFIGGALFVGLLRYKPTRFCHPIILPLLGMAALGLSEFYRSGELRSTFKRRWAADLAGVLTLTAIFRMKLYLHDSTREVLQFAEIGLLPGQWDSLLASTAFAILIWGCIRLLLIRFVPEPVAIPRVVRGGVVLLVVAHFLYGNISASFRWWNDRHHSIAEAGRKIKDREHMVIGGLSVHALVMENSHRAVRIEHGGWHNSLGKRIFTDLGLTHLLLTDYNHLRRSYFVNWPRQMAKLKRIDSFRMCGQQYHLYEFPQNWRARKVS